MPVSSRAVGCLTGAFLAVGEAAVVYAVPWLHPRATDVRVLVVGLVLLSSMTGALIALVVHPRAGGPGTWSFAVRSVAIGVFVGVASFLLLYLIV